MLGINSLIYANDVTKFVQEHNCNMKGSGFLSGLAQPIQQHFLKFFEECLLSLKKQHVQYLILPTQIWRYLELFPRIFLSNSFEGNAIDAYTYINPAPNWFIKPYRKTTTCITRIMK